jgi:hypothetical protein
MTRSSNLRSDFLNFFRIDFFTQRITFFAKKIVFIRVDRRVIGVEELESAVRFFKFFFDRFFYTKDYCFYKKNCIFTRIEYYHMTLVRVFLTVEAQYFLSEKGQRIQRMSAILLYFGRLRNRKKCFLRILLRVILAE